MRAVSPTRIVDKNGKSTVVYRSIDKPQATKTALATQAPKLRPADRKRQEWGARSMDTYMAEGSRLARFVHPDLQRVLGTVETSGNSYRVLARGTTQSELAGMLSVASPATVLMVSGSQDIRSADELCNYLESVQLGHLIEDNSEQMELIEKRMTDVGALIESINLGMGLDTAECSWADLTEVIASRTFAETDIPDKVHAGEVAWSYIKEVGASSFSQYQWEILPKIDEFTAAQIKQAISVVRSGSNVVPGRDWKQTRRDEIIEVIYAMERIGTDDALSMRVPGLLREMNQKGLLLDTAQEDRPRAARYVDDLIHRVRETGAEVGELSNAPDRKRLKGYPPPIETKMDWGTPKAQEYVVPLKEAVAYFHEGIPVDDAIKYMSLGIDAAKARGMFDNNIATAVHDGWL